MAKGCKKCDPHDLCEECPEWIFTLADLIMCMMGLFVILWVLKPGMTPKPGSPESERMNEVIGGIREGFQYVPDPHSTDPVDLLMLEKIQRRARMDGPGEKGKTRLESKGADGSDPLVTAIRAGKQAAVGGRILFEKEAATLGREDIDQLDQIILQIRGHRNIVMIKGHTSLDELPETATPEQKMDLSLRRAQVVGNYITSKGVSPDIVRVQGCSTFEPVQQRAYTSSMQAMNRRVEVEVTASLVEDFQDRQAEVPTTITSPAAKPTGQATVRD